MKIVKFCAVLNVFVLLVALQGHGSEDQVREEDLSENAQKIYKCLPAEESKNLFLRHYKEKLGFKNQVSAFKDQVCKLESEKGYNEFMCAASLLKSQTERIFPSFLGEWINGRNSRYERFMNNLFVNVPLNGKMSRFRLIERLKLVESKHVASRKIPNFFRQMYAMLKRYDDPNFEGCLKNNSLRYAENIMAKFGIQQHPITLSRMEAAIKDFCYRYAHIRHCFNVFGHHQNVDIADTVKKLTITLKKSKITLCEVLEDMGILRLWQFSKEDIDAMNDISNAIIGESIYYSRPCYSKIDGKTIEVLIPFTAAENCPIVENIPSSSSLSSSSSSTAATAP